MRWKKILSLLLVMSMASHAPLALAAEMVAGEKTALETMTEWAAATEEETAEVIETPEAAEVTDRADMQEVTVEAAEVVEETTIESVEEIDEQEVIAEDTDDISEIVPSEVMEDAAKDIVEDAMVIEADREGQEAIAEPVYVVSFDDEEAEISLEEIIKPVILLDASPSEPRNIKDVNYVSIDRPIEINGETYQIVMAGIPEEYVDDLVDFITDYYKSVDPDKIEYTGTNNLIDAEKWSVMVSGVDSNHCWAATASNMLWNSGWANMAINPRTGETFHSEDELLTYFTCRMSDGLGNSLSGIEWFFNALYDLQYDIDEVEGTTAKLKKTDTADEDLPFLDSEDGLLTDLLAEKILHYVSVNGDLSAISILKELAYDATDSKSIGLSLRFYDEERFTGGHAVTVFGIIFDTLANSAEAMYKAIVLADSDDDADVVPEDLHISNFWEWMADKETRKNAYQIYHLNPIELNGTVYWEIMDYTDDERTTVINGFYVLDNYTDKIKAEITEEEGTCDLRKGYDLSLVYLGMEYDTYELGEEIEIELDFTNRSYIKLDSENIADIPYSYRIIRDGEVILTKNSSCKNNGLKPLSDNLKSLTVNLKDSIGSDLPAGTYTIEFTINPYADGNEIPEAYYQNNTMSISFTIVETEETGKEPVVPDPVKPAEEVVEEKQPSYVTIPFSLLHVLEVENNGDWDLTKEEEKDYFTVKVFYPASEFLDLIEITKDENGKTVEKKVEKENYCIVDNNETFTIEFNKKYLGTLEEGKHTFAISLLSLFEKLTFDVDIKNKESI